MRTVHGTTLDVLTPTARVQVPAQVLRGEARAPVPAPAPTAEAPV